MAVSIEDFFEKATEDQKQLLFELVELGEQENTICEKYNKKIEPYSKMAKETNPMMDGQYAKIIKEDAEDFALLATRKEREKLKRIRDEMKTLYLKAVEINMGNLGIIQRNYENYVKGPMNI